MVGIRRRAVARSGGYFGPASRNITDAVSFHLNHAITKATSAIQGSVKEYGRFSMRPPGITCYTGVAMAPEK